MANFIITYDISDDTSRAKFEEILLTLKFTKETTNQSTYYGNYRSSINDLNKELHNAVSKNINWEPEDNVTIYYPSSYTSGEKRYPDIGRHAFKRTNEQYNFIHTV